MNEAYLDDFRRLTVIVETKGKTPKAFHLRGNDEVAPLTIDTHERVGDRCKYTLSYAGFVFLNKRYVVEADTGQTMPLHSGKIVRTEAFDDLYAYDGDDLGHTYSPEETRFKVWTPIAKAIKLERVDANGTTYHDFRYDNQGVWSLTLEGDHEGARYRLHADVNGRMVIANDPYAIASTANGEYNVVVDQAKAFGENITPAPEFSGDPTDAVIYEASVRDLTSDSSLNLDTPSTYLAASRHGLKTPCGRPAGLDYLVDLGVTHVQYLPFYDFEGIDETNPQSEYNWGYNPMQYFVPEGSYASDPNDPYARIKELRQMIDAHHQAGLRVVMDVVYNHVYDAERFSLEKLVPGYAFRYDKRGMLTEASGCGNDLATERRMIRKLIVDSVMHFATRYHVDGFRFDLMGLIDITTMHRLRQRLENHRKDIIVYGEGWNIHSTLPDAKRTHQRNDDVVLTIGFFNDSFREAMKGSTFKLDVRGFALGGVSDTNVLERLLKGSVYRFAWPAQSINYVACHDNHTLYDKIQAAMPEVDEETRHRHQELATAMTVLAQGVPFIHMGQEFMRTKGMDENSYQSGDHVNRIDWALVDTHQDAITRLKQLIDMRKREPLFRLKSKPTINRAVQVEKTKQGSLLYQIHGENETLVVIFKPRLGTERLSVDREAEVRFTADANATLLDGMLTLEGIATTVLKGR